MSLASKLPWNHRFAGGYPGLSSQPLPTDADALDYLSRMAAADGAGVETGVAVALDAFFKDLKATPGLFDAIKASCILCGARTITGALVPLAGDAPTAQGGWAAGDYLRTAGLTGDGNALYLDTNRASDDDPYDDAHYSFWVSALPSSTGLTYFGYTTSTTGVRAESQTTVGNNSFTLLHSATASNLGPPTGGGLVGASRSSNAEFDAISGANTETVSDTAVSQSASLNFHVFRRNRTDGGSVQYSDATIAFYSIGTSLSLAALDTAVTNLITAIGEAL